MSMNLNPQYADIGKSYLYEKQSKIINFTLLFHICMKLSSSLDLAQNSEINKKTQKCRQRLRGSILPAVRQSSAEELAGEHVQCELALVD